MRLDDKRFHFKTTALFTVTQTVAGHKQKTVAKRLSSTAWRFTNQFMEAC